MFEHRTVKPLEPDSIFYIIFIFITDLYSRGPLRNALSYGYLHMASQADADGHNFKYIDGWEYQYMHFSLWVPAAVPL